MTTKKPKKHPSKEEARAIFHAAFDKGGTVIYPKYAKARMKERDIDANDLMELSRCGFVYDSPEPHIKTGDMVYRMENSKLVIKIAFNIVNKKTIRIITVMDSGKGRSKP
ncbi:MAG: DUF4258 domain-containing protein [Nitrospinae bacterium]|nr:DUF4258 domain-containing protein [Nitrospinota bacterium]